MSAVTGHDQLVKLHQIEQKSCLLNKVRLGVQNNLTFVAHVNRLLWLWEQNLHRISIMTPLYVKKGSGGIEKTALMLHMPLPCVKLDTPFVNFKVKLLVPCTCFCFDQKA